MIHQVVLQQMYLLANYLYTQLQIKGLSIYLLKATIIFI